MQVVVENNKINLKSFLYEIVHHCNLNCNYCDHCAPIAEPEFVDINTYKNDLKHLKKYLIKYIQLMLWGENRYYILN